MSFDSAPLVINNDWSLIEYLAPIPLKLGMSQQVWQLALCYIKCLSTPRQVHCLKCISLSSKISVLPVWDIYFCTLHIQMFLLCTTTTDLFSKPKTGYHILNGITDLWHLSMQLYNSFTSNSRHEAATGVLIPYTIQKWPFRVPLNFKGEPWIHGKVY